MSGGPDRRLASVHAAEVERLRAMARALEERCEMAEREATLLRLQARLDRETLRFIDAQLDPETENPVSIPSLRLIISDILAHE